MGTRLHTPSLIRAAGIFCLLMGCVLPLLIIRSRDAQELEEVRLNQLATLVGRRLEQELATRVGVLEFFARSYPKLQIESYEDFARWSRPIRDGVLGFYAINFINPDRVIQWVEPFGRNQSALGKNLGQRSELNVYLTAATEARMPRLSHFTTLYQGPRGVVAYIPAFDGERLLGYVNGVFLLDEFVAPLALPASVPNAVRISTPGVAGSEVFASAELPATARGALYETTIFGQRLLVEAFGTPAQGPAALVDQATSVVLGGIVTFALIISAISYLLMHSRERLRVRLEHERFQGTLLNLLVHDLLNPLLVVRYGVDAAQRTASTEARAQLAKVHRGIDQLHEVIARVRDLRALELGKAKLRTDAIRVNDIIRDAHANFEEPLRDKGLVADFELCPENPAIEVDRVIFQSNVVGNLLANAVKFSEPGAKIRMSARVRRDHVIVQVEDQGIGMGPEIVATLFDETVELSKPGTRGELGTGIGMLQVMSYTRFFGGRVAVQSRPKGQYPASHGTTVTLTLPLAVTAPPPS